MTFALLGLLAAVNPAAAAATLERDRRTDRPVPVGIGVLLTIAALVGLAAVSDRLLDALAVNLGTFRLGAGIVVLFAGIRWLVLGSGPAAEEPSSNIGLATFVTFPTLLTPGAVTLAVSIGAEHGAGRVFAAGALAAAVGGLGVFFRRTISPGIVIGGIRLFGGVAAVVGVLVAVDGVRTL